MFFVIFVTFVVVTYPCMPAGLIEAAGWTLANAMDEKRALLQSGHPIAV